MYELSTYTFDYTQQKTTLANYLAILINNLIKINTFKLIILRLLIDILILFL